MESVMRNLYRFGYAAMRLFGGTTDKSHNCQKPEAELNEIYVSIIKQKHQAPMKSDSHKEVSSHADEIPRGRLLLPDSCM